jgi:hypothetical protein
MDPDREQEIDDLLKENVRLARENNRLLRKMRRGQLLSTLGTITFYLIVIGVPLFIYRYYLADYVAQWQQTYEQLKVNTSSLKNLPANVLPAAVKEQLDTVTQRFE